LIIFDLDSKEHYTIPEEIANKKYYSSVALDLACWGIDIYFTNREKCLKFLRLADKVNNIKLKSGTYTNVYTLNKYYDHPIF